MLRGGRVDVAKPMVSTTPIPALTKLASSVSSSITPKEDTKRTKMTPDEDAKLTKMLDENVSLMNADGTENTEAVNLLNKLGEALAKPPVKAGRRRRRTYRKRR